MFEGPLKASLTLKGELVVERGSEGREHGAGQLNIIIWFVDGGTKAPYIVPSGATVIGP